ncbi:MAG: hypothetical protein IT287_01390 [Bdellovibrionaceae bacterium]|nr:hypothetical protein [Pseudobdellovibrionaceae bacterium]
MFEKVTLDEFLSLNELDKTSLLFIKEQGCKYCEIAESEMRSVGLAAILPTINFYEVSINDDSSVATRLGLTGVPAFFKIELSGKKRLRTGFEGIEGLTNFILSEIE